MTDNTATPRIEELANQLLTRDMVADPNEALEMATATVEHRDYVWQRLVPTRFHDVAVSDLNGTRVAAAVEEWQQNTTRNLLLLGNIGVGKTHAAFVAARLAYDRGSSFGFWPVVELLDALRPGGNETTMDRALTVDLLILDDLGGERPTDWTGERLYALVNRRWLERRPIIATSNLDARNGQGRLVDAIGLRVYSRLVQDAVLYKIGGKDRRRSS
jgi:DNA replication protein DnaC